jgi:hypothetical protein
MPEVYICVHCEGLVRLDVDEYVVINRLDYDGNVRPGREWVFAHARCYEEQRALNMASATPETPVPGGST